jgi:hypothetical protein
MSISPRKRFLVFKRDNFTCQYCGKKSPDVTLEPDHIIPRMRGGTNDLENLITACYNCNRGKSDISVIENTMRDKIVFRFPKYKWTDYDENVYQSLRRNPDFNEDNFLQWIDQRNPEINQQTLFGYQDGDFWTPSGGFWLLTQSYDDKYPIYTDVVYNTLNQLEPII